MLKKVRKNIKKRLNPVVLKENLSDKVLEERVIINFNQEMGKIIIPEIGSGIL